MSSHFKKTITAGEYIFREGDPGECAFMIEGGQVQITIKKDNEDVPIAVLTSGDIFGEMAIIDGMPRSASAFAMEDCELTVVSRELFNKRVFESDPILKLLITLLLKRVRNTNFTFKGKSALAHTEPINFNNSMNLTEARERLKLENDLLKGLINNEFYLEYQPIIDLKSRDLIGFEGLMRWNSPERGKVRPDVFIDAAEETSVIIPLGEWCLHQGFKDLKTLQSRLSRPDLYMSLNVSVRQFNDPQFGARLQGAQEEQNVVPEQIKLEVTERIFQEGPLILDTVRAVREKGYSIALDDFGTGYSSLNSLFNLKVDYVKIDRAFVSALTKDPKSKGIVRAIIAMATELGLGVVAEGIENDIEVKLLTDMGCNNGQGYLFCRPISIDELVKRYGVKKAVA